MTGEEAPVRVRRILLALDASPDSRAALDLVSRLAALLEAELRGLYVEDERLAELTDLTFLREVDAVSGRVRQIQDAEVERQLRAEATRAGRDLARVGEQMGIRWSFRVSRGKVAAEVTAAARESDLVTVGVRSRRAGGRVGSTVRALVRARGNPVLIVRRGMRLGDRVHVLDDGSEEAARAVALAEAISRRPRATLTVDVEGDREDQHARIEAHRERFGRKNRDDVVVQPVPAHGPGSTPPGMECGLLVLPRTRVVDGDVDLDELLRTSACPILIAG